MNVQMNVRRTKTELHSERKKDVNERQVGRSDNVIWTYVCPVGIVLVASHKRHWMISEIASVFSEKAISIIIARKGHINNNIALCFQPNKPLDLTQSATHSKALLGATCRWHAAGISRRHKWHNPDVILATCRRNMPA